MVGVGMILFEAYRIMLTAKPFEQDRRKDVLDETVDVEDDGAHEFSFDGFLDVFHAFLVCYIVVFTDLPDAMVPPVAQLRY